MVLFLMKKISPLLFLLYINDLCTSPTQLFPVMVADDTNLFLHDKNISYLEEVFNIEIEKIDQWLTANKFSLNI